MSNVEGFSEDWPRKLERAQEELTSVYSEIYPPLPDPRQDATGKTTPEELFRDHDSGVFSVKDIHALRQSDELNFHIFFLREMLHIGITNIRREAVNAFGEKYNPMVTFKGDKADQLFKKLSLESRLVLVEQAERNNEIYLFDVPEKQREEIIKKIKWRWSQNAEAN